MASLSLFLCSLVILLKESRAIAPKWTPTYQMNRSTVVMPCNESGYFSDEVLKELARYGVVDIDWSNAKQVWASTSPMNDQELLLLEAQKIKAINPTTKVWVYRNLAKALPWFTDVREKILNPAYNNWWFLKFKPSGPYYVQPCTNTTINKCSIFYHDQEQTPHYPSQCTNGQCDCGGGANNAAGLPCGEYLWDHRNKTLQKWLTDVYIMGSGVNGTGLLNPAIDGFYIDDGWKNQSSGGGSQCNDFNTFGGVTEEDKHCIQDMGMNANDVNNIYAGWLNSMSYAHQTIVENNGFDWQLFHRANAPSKSSCAGWMRGSGTHYNNNDTALMLQYVSLNDTQTEFEIDLATFLLIRGPFAWLGYGWNGCHSTWEYAWNPMLDRDYGEPKGPMKEVTTGVFQREWSKVTVQLDCNAYKPTFNWL